MLGYNELYELLRKEKYSESLQQLPKNFLSDFKEYVLETRKTLSFDSSLFSDSISKSKKQLENAMSLFRELMLKRKRKILNLVFIAAETGIMKKDYENMLSSERTSFDFMVKSFEQSDKEISSFINNHEIKKATQKMIIFKQGVEPFIDHNGKTCGPFKIRELANLDCEIADIFVSEGKASFVDEPN